MIKFHRLIRRLTGLAGLMLALAPHIATATGQFTNRSTMIIDDGETRRVLNMSHPNMQRVRQPDIDLQDMPLFEQHLSLSEPQVEAVKRAIEDYLAQLEQLVKDDYPGYSPPVASPKEDAAKSDGDGAQVGAEQKRESFSDIVLDEMRKIGLKADSMKDLPVQPKISVDFRTGHNEAGGERSEPEVDVSISFDTEDDSLTGEMRAKLAQVANKAAARYAEQARKDAEQRMAAPVAPAQPPRSPAEQIEAAWTENQAIRKRVEEFLEKKNALHTALMTQIMAVLAEPQLERWPALGRAITRDKTLPLAKLDGEGTNLLKIINALELPASEMRAVGELLDAYEISLHEALQLRNRLLDDVDVEVDQALYDGKPDIVRSLVDRLTSARTAVRNVNDQFIDTLAAELSPDSAQAFREAALQASYPTIYRTTVGERAFKQAAELEELDAQTLETIGDLRTAYLAELALVNDRIRRGVRQQQTDEQREWVDRLVAMIEGPTAPAPSLNELIAEHFNARQQLNARYMSSLYEMLPPHLVAELPPVPTVDVTEPITAQQSR